MSDLSTNGIKLTLLWAGIFMMFGACASFDHGTGRSFELLSPPAGLVDELRERLFSEAFLVDFPENRKSIDEAFRHLAIEHPLRERISRWNKVFAAHINIHSRPLYVFSSDPDFAGVLLVFAAPRPEPVFTHKLVNLCGLTPADCKARLIEISSPADLVHDLRKRLGDHFRLGSYPEFARTHSMIFQYLATEHSVGSLVAKWDRVYATEFAVEDGKKIGSIFVYANNGDFVGELIYTVSIPNTEYDRDIYVFRNRNRQWSQISFEEYAYETKTPMLQQSGFVTLNGGYPGIVGGGRPPSAGSPGA